jgi:flavin-dependent dehydrogenase
MAQDAQVIVVGAGPAGSAAALFLAREGCDVLVLDRARFPRDKPCAEYLSPQASRILEAMGVLEAVTAAGAARLVGMKIRAPNGVEAVGRFNAGHPYRGHREYGLALRRLLLDGLLLDSVRGAQVRVLEGVHVRDLLTDSRGHTAGVQVQQPDGTLRELRARLVIGADGLRSVVARRSGLGRHGRWPRRMALVAHYEAVSGMTEFGEMRVGEDGYVGLAPVDSGLVNVALVVPASRAREMSGDAAGFLARRLSLDQSLSERLTRARRVGPVRTIGPFNWRAACAWRPGLVLVGDAADFFDPFTGEGIYAALRGGEMLAPYAIEAVHSKDRGGAAAALASYDRTRRLEFSGKWKLERAVGVAVASKGLMNAATRALTARPDLADLLVGVTGDFVPPSEVLRTGYIWQLAAAAVTGIRGPRPTRTAGTAAP